MTGDGLSPRPSRSHRRVIFAVHVFRAALLLPGIGCATPTGAYWPGVAFTPPVTYAAMYSRVEECSERRGNYAAMRFYEAPDGALGDRVMGRWLAPHNVYLTTWVVVTDSVESITTMHEMLHALLDGDPEHQHEVWDRCGLNP
jgi:hypothetical protein